MKFSERFIQKHLLNSYYIEQVHADPFPQYLSWEGWTDSILHQELVYSHRKTQYTNKNFTDKLHAHDYYELQIYVSGDIEYIHENEVISVTPYTVVWFQPGRMHTSRLLAESEFDRHIIYFTKDFFTISNSITPITNFMDHIPAGSLKLSHTAAEEMVALLKKIEQALCSNQPYKELLVNAHLVELFALINNEEPETLASVFCRDHATKVKQYIDTNYSTINSVNEIAEHFFYSREYLSRIFKTAFNISVAQYLSRKRILESLPLLSNVGAINAGLAVGFHSHQSFLNTFKKVMGCLPSEYIRGS